jgi:hypothetical protein
LRLYQRLVPPPEHTILLEVRETLEHGHAKLRAEEFQADVS